MSFFTFCQVSFFFFFLFFAAGTWQVEPRKTGDCNRFAGTLLCVCLQVRLHAPHPSSPEWAGQANHSLPCFPSLLHHSCSFNSHSTKALLFTPHPAPTPPLYSPASTLGEQSQRKCYNRGISQMYIQLARVNAVLSHCAVL